ncbi:hypothetical protein GCM10010365_56330 [Streptomyces poonensis]|uniref:Uncharacterized protein n=1 Tax=Streptomyces poonensis TaxID=68255 RepID=A0A918PZX2_9ACTN|nr:hypothetical protein GCM10010365_56330 [Streptomyces poonensis]
MPLSVVLVAFDPGCQRTLSSAVIGSDWTGAAAGPRISRVHWTPVAAVVIRSFGDSEDAKAENRRIQAGRGRVGRSGHGRACRRASRRRTGQQFTDPFSGPAATDGGVVLRSWGGAVGTGRAVVDRSRA